MTTTYTQSPNGGLWNLGLCPEEDSPARSLRSSLAQPKQQGRVQMWGVTGASVMEPVSREQKSYPKSTEVQRPCEVLVGSLLSVV